MSIHLIEVQLRTENDQNPSKDLRNNPKYSFLWKGWTNFYGSFKIWFGNATGMALPISKMMCPSHHRHLVKILAAKRTLITLTSNTKREPTTRWRPHVNWATTTNKYDAAATGQHATRLRLIRKGVGNQRLGDSCRIFFDSNLLSINCLAGKGWLE